MTTEAEILQGYIDTWREAVDSAIAVLRDLDDEEWALPTDLDGWDVKAVAAHLAHLESELVGNPQEQVQVEEAPHIKSLIGLYTEAGVLVRRDWEPSRIIDEFEAAAKQRAAELDANPPTDGSAVPERTPGGIGWPWRQLLRNRALDVWMHEQDIRRATSRPGGLDSRGGLHALTVLGEALPYIVGKGASAPEGTTFVLSVTGEHSALYSVVVPPGGRAVLTDDIPLEPTVAMIMDLESAVLLSGGRKDPAEVPVGITGDRALADAILNAMAVTP
jgi:uncharacterized protein (TIGR03083 family)